jgi:peptidyl-tRNA hydrolase
MNPVMYIFVNKGLGMSSGKMAAQASHAAVLAAKGSKSKMLREWNNGGHYCKLVMEVSNANELMMKERYFKERGFKTFIVIDEGLTEDTTFVPTALGIEVVDKDNVHTHNTFMFENLYREPKEQYWRILLLAGIFGLLMLVLGLILSLAKVPYAVPLILFPYLLGVFVMLLRPLTKS